MIKYLGSKRALVPVLGAIATAVGARTAVDLFTGTTRVAQEFKRRGLYTTAADLATYSAVLSDCYIATDAAGVDMEELDDALGELDALPGRRGYVTATFCEQARFFQPKNGARIDAIRDAVERWRDTALYPILLTSLLLAADRVDSTTGLQMAYLKTWAPRASNDLVLRRPALLSGPGATVAGDVLDTVAVLPPVDLVYIDPPYNQHRYFTNYHIWETLIRWDRPSHYGIACKRADSRDAATRSAFDSKRLMPDAFADVLARARADLLLVSYNDEGWVTPDQVAGWLRDTGREAVELLAFDSKRYVGAQIGVYNPAGHKVGEAKRLRNVEYVIVAGSRDAVATACAAAREPVVPVPAGAAR
ncbi:DNA adenine methylase [Propionicicella superfundia]|uniref:DNA adenine methylase n=1 Tax=Propionicicella superfundia TaxID=348582 RepID=UPI000423A858|nr:DNA adenine methylase [Propionicicella superfundia]